MILTLPNGRQLRGDIVKSIVLRSDLAPIPATLEADIRIDDELKRMLSEGKTISANGDVFYIIKSEGGHGRLTQGQHSTDAVRITALLNACHQSAFVREKAIIKENASLSEIYRASGASVKAIDADFAIPRFTCPVGQVPTFHIARALQEEGGVVRWKAGKMKFFRLRDLFQQKPVMSLPDIASENVNSGFLERHEVPFFYSLKGDGGFIHGNQAKARTARYAPFKNSLRLQNMTRCLVQKKVSKINLSPRLAAGDLIGITGAQPLVIVTAAHVLQSNTDGSGGNQYTKLWLSGLSN
jgi:hypothetical protein